MPTDPLVAALERWIGLTMHQSMRAFIRYARERGLSMSHLGALFHIHHQGRCGVTEIGDHLGVTSAAASQLLDRLVQQDLVLRTEDPHDRRVKQIGLTGQGNRLLQEAVRARQAWLADLARALSDDEKRSIMAALDILMERVADLREPVKP